MTLRDRRIAVSLISSALAIVGLGLWNTSLARAEEKAAEVPAAAAEKPANPDAVQQRGQAQIIRKETAATAARLANAAGELKAAVDAYVAAREKKAQAFEELAKALEDQDSEKATKIGQVTILQLTALAERTQAKLWALESAAEYAQTPQTLIADTPADAKTELDAMIAARQAVAKACTNYAQIITPDAPQAAIEDAYDQFLARVDDMTLAAKTWNDARQSSYQKGPKEAYKNQDLDKQIDAVAASAKALRDAERQQNELKAQIRKLERAVARTNDQAMALSQKIAAEKAAKPAVPADPAAVNK